MSTTAVEGESTIAEVVETMNEPHDRMSFDELKNSYNFQQTTCWKKTFLRLLAEEADIVRKRNGQVRALDVGCGVGICRRPNWTAAVREHFDELVGIEPDPTVEPNPEIMDSYQTATLETAELPESYFDLIYSFMVVEHVANPDSFLSTVSRALRPGGVHFFVTVNGGHYFAHAAKTMRRLRLEDAALRIVRGKQEIEDYHYPVEYRMNRPSQLDKMAKAHDFLPPEYVFIEEDGPYPYFPGPLKLILKSLMLKRKLIRNPQSLLTMYCRMQKKG